MASKFRFGITTVNWYLSERIPFLDQGTVRHSSRRVYLHPVIIDINVNLAPIDQVVAVDQPVYCDLKYHFLNTAIIPCRRLFPHINRKEEQQLFAAPVSYIFLAIEANNAIISGFFRIFPSSSASTPSGTCSVFAGIFRWISGFPSFFS